ncbi:MAG: flagellar basal body-associated FliL family protein [Planctomycetaceae bacterium]|jgi:flagellar basal body-associated protein FliL|nr:flagellar basal body-associated FliL family protein [Planctomycetaceae bacterium]
MAKEQKAVELPPDNAAELAQQKSATSMRLIIVLALVALVLGQTIILYMMLPDPQELSKDIRKEIPELPETLNVNLPDKPITDIDTHNWVEKSLGDQFKLQVRNRTNPALYDSTNIKITVRVDGKDSSKFDKIFATRSEKIRDLTYTVLREATPEEMDAPTMLSIKQKIMKRINEELRYPYVKEVLCTEISTSTS